MNTLLSDYFGFAVAVAAHLPSNGFRRIPYRHEHFAVHLITSSSLRRLAELRKVEQVDVRRFRPTLLVETDDAPCFLEKNWTGKGLALNSTELLVREETTRCGMTFISQPGIEDDPEILRTILRNNKRHLGVSCAVDVAGNFCVGDDVAIHE